MEKGRKGEYVTGRTYNFPQVIKWECTGEYILFTDESRGMGLMKVPTKYIIAKRDENIGRQILEDYDNGRYIMTSEYQENHPSEFK
jgi:hypothetical protein